MSENTDLTQRPAPPPLAGSPGEVALVNPDTGEVVALDAPAAELANVLAAVRRWEDMARQAKRTISAELHRRMDADASWTINLGDGTKAVGQSPARTTVDADGLWEELALLVDGGTISAVAADAAVEEVCTRKVKAKGCKALLALGGLAAEAVRRHTQADPRPRTIKLSGGGA